MHKNAPLPTSLTAEVTDSIVYLWLITLSTGYICFQVALSLPRGAGT